MTASRRAFLFGIAGAASLIAAPKLILSQLPTLWGDGEHDDTEALQHLFDGKPIRLPTGDTFKPRFERDPIVLDGGVYRVTETLHMRDFVDIRNATFLGHEVKSGALLTMPLDARGNLFRCSLQNARLAIESVRA